MVQTLSSLRLEISIFLDRLFLPAYLELKDNLYYNHEATVRIKGGSNEQNFLVGHFTY
jgi:hypothetical protein